MARQSFNSSGTLEQELPKAKLNKHALTQIAKLFVFLKPYQWAFFLGLAMLFLESIVSLFFPFLMGKLVDVAVPKSDVLPVIITQKLSFFGNLSQKSTLFTTINGITVALLVILFVQASLSFFRISSFVKVGESVLADLRLSAFEKMISLPMNFFANNRVGELQSRISSDLAQIQDTLTTTLAMIIRQLVVLSGGIAFLWFISAKLTLMMLGVFPFLIVAAVVFGKFIRKISRQAQDKLAQSNTVLEETLQAIASVKAFTNEWFESQRYKKSIDEVVVLAKRGAIFRGSFASFIIFCLFGSIVLVVWYGCNLVNQSEISVGELTSFIIYSTFVGGAMGSFAELYAQIQKSVGATERIFEILGEHAEPINLKHIDTKPLVPLSTANLTPKIPTGLTIEFRNLAFSYPSRQDVQTLKDINFTVNGGEKLALVGASGAGKSTIVNLLLRFYEPTSGQILINNQDLQTFDLTQIRGKMAIVPQDVLLFGGTIFENIAYGKPDASADEVVEASKKANAHTFISEIPQGYQAIVGERGIKLSGGQRQRIAIARAVLKNPELLILDEATSSLDSQSEQLVQEALDKLMKNRTSIIIAHRLSTIKNADKIAVIRDGQIVEFGKHLDLMNVEHGIYKSLKLLQTDLD